MNNSLLILWQIIISINGPVCWWLAGSKGRRLRLTPIYCLFSQAVFVPYLIVTEQPGLLLMHIVYFFTNLRNLWTMTTMPRP